MLSLTPQHTNFSNAHNGRVSLLPLPTPSLSFANFGLQTLQGGNITATQIQAVHNSLLRVLNGYNPHIIWSIFPNIPITHNTLGVPMGNGNGTVDHWISSIRPGQILFEINSSSQPNALKALSIATYNLPLNPLNIYVNT